VNLCLRNTVFFFTKLQSFDHHTKQLNAYINKYIVLYFFNSAFMPYLVHGYIDGDAIDIELLIWDIHFVVLATSVSTPLSKLFDPMIFYKMFKRWHITSFSKGDCPYTQKEANFWFEGHPFEIADSCTDKIKNFFTILLNSFSHFFTLENFNFLIPLFTKMLTWLEYCFWVLGMLRLLLSAF